MILLGYIKIKLDTIATKMQKSNVVELIVSVGDKISLLYFQNIEVVCLVTTSSGECSYSSCLNTASGEANPTI